MDTTGAKATLPHHLLFNVIAFGEKFDHLLRIFDGMASMVYEEFQAQAEAHDEIHQMVANDQ